MERVGGGVADGEAGPVGKTGAELLPPDCEAPRKHKFTWKGILSSDTHKAVSVTRGGQQSPVGGLREAAVRGIGREVAEVCIPGS